MVEEATTDCYNEGEQATGLFTMLEANLEVPFETSILGVTVTVERVDLNASDQIVAVCRRKSDTAGNPASGPPVADAAPKGAEWIAAYRHWLGGK